LILGLILLLMPKKLTRQEVYIIWIVVSFITIVSDLYFGDVLDLYDLLDPGHQHLDIVIELSLPAAFGLIYMNFMPEKRSHFLWYFLYWVVFSVIYEQISRYFGYVIYKGWKVWYSFLFYIFACLFMLWHYKFIRKAIYKNSEPKKQK
jgi:hypothetical protein